MQDVDYEATMAVKLSIAKRIFNLEKEKVLSSSSFQKFFSENQVRPFFFPCNFLQPGYTK